MIGRASRAAAYAAPAWLASALLSSCTTYSPAPLSSSPDLLGDVASLKVNATDMRQPASRARALDLSRPLDMDGVATLAVMLNPDLRAARAQVGVATAQSFSAGLLPDPQFSFSYQFLLAGPATTASAMAGLTQDVLSILTRPVRKSAATANEERVRLNLLWQEWQVVSLARTFFAKAVALKRQRTVLAATRQLFNERYQRSSSAMKSGNELLQTVVSDQTALQGAESQLHTLDQQILKNQHDLDGLLGLIPDAKLVLADTVSVQQIDAAKIKALLPELAQRRPDLLALAAGYRSQDANYRRAIIEQFPALSIGAGGGNDTTPIYTAGPSFTIGVPIFNRNQGNVAIERATRQQLHDEYQARLDAAYGAAARLITEQQLVEAQYQASLEGIRQLREGVGVADRAYAAGNLDERSYVDLRASLLAKEIESLTLEDVMLEQRISLQTLIGTNLPTSLPAGSISQ
jgi:outer membrane protein TolC